MSPEIKHFNKKKLNVNLLKKTERNNSTTQTIYLFFLRKTYLQYLFIKNS